MVGGVDWVGDVTGAVEAAEGGGVVKLVSSWRGRGAMARL